MHTVRAAQRRRPASDNDWRTYPPGITPPGSEPPPCQWQGRTKLPGHNPLVQNSHVHNVRCRFMLQERGFWKGFWPRRLCSGGFRPPILKFSFQVGDVWFCGFYPALPLNGDSYLGGLCPGGYVRSPLITGAKMTVTQQRWQHTCSADDTFCLLYHHYLLHQPSNAARLWLSQHNLRPAIHNVTQEASRRFGKLVSSVSQASCRRRSWRRKGVDVGNLSRLN